MQLAAGLLVQVAGELGEHRHLPVLGQVQPQGAHGALHGLCLGRAAHTGDGQAHIDSGALAGEEQAALQKQLAVGDGDDVGGDIGGHVPGLSLYDGQGGHAAAAPGGAQAGGALQQAGVEGENIAGVGLAPRGAAQQQAEGPVGDGVLGQVVVDDEHILATVHEVFAHGGSGVGGDVLHRGGLARAGAHHDGVVHGAAPAQLLGDLGNRADLLPDGHIDAHHVLALLVQDGVDGDGGLARLPVADDQLTLAPADGEHGVDSQDAGLHGGIHRLAVHDAGSGGLDGGVALGSDGTLAVYRDAQGVDDPAQKALAHGQTGGPACAVHGAAFAH